MPPKQLSGAQKRKMKKREDQIVLSQAGDINKYFKFSSKKESHEDETLAQEEHQIEEDEQEKVNDQFEEDEQEKVCGQIEEDEQDKVSDHLESQPIEDEEVIEQVMLESSTHNADFLLQDPANWKNIDQKMRDYLVERGPQRINGIVYPVNEKGRHFDSSQYTRILPNGQKENRRWLVYSVSLDRIFCFCCKLFAIEHTLNKIGVLAADGFCDWKNMHIRLKSHEGSKEHIHCMTSWKELEDRLGNKETIDESVQLQIDKEKEHLKKVLRRIIVIVKRLAKNSLPFRGDNEKLFVENNGIFLQMVEMMAEVDPVLEEHLRRAQTREIQYTYLSPTIQNEFIQLLASEVRSAIIKKVKHAKYYSIILDCTPDASHEEQMSLVIRCVDDSTDSPTLEEFWIQFLKVDDTFGLGLSTELINILEKLDLDVDDIRGQGYDNGSNMSGRHKGVQRRLLELNPRAFYTPCGCHSLNLTLCDMANSCRKARTFFGVIQRVYTLFSSSTKRWKIFKDHVVGLTVKPLSQTRWESHVESVKAIKEQTVQIRDALLFLAETSEDPKTQSDAETLAKYELNNFEFLLGMVIWYRMLQVINKVSKNLQSKDVDIEIAITLLQGLIVFFDDFREHGFQSAMNEAKVMASELGVEATFLEKRIVRRKKQFDESGSDEVNQSPEESFRVDYFLYIVDQARSSLQERFEKFKEYEHIFGFLLNVEKLKTESLESLLKFCIDLERYLKHNGNADIIGDDLCTELLCLQPYFSKEKSRAIDLLRYLKKMNCFPNAYISYKILLTIPVTVASAERSFSKLKLIKTYLRSTMLQDRLNGLAMLSIERKMVDQLDYTDLINTFASKTARRVMLR